MYKENLALHDFMKYLQQTVVNSHKSMRNEVGFLVSLEDKHQRIIPLHHHEAGGQLGEVVFQYRFHKQGDSSSFGTSAPHYHRCKRICQIVFILKNQMDSEDIASFWRLYKNLPAFISPKNVVKQQFYSRMIRNFFL